MVQVIGNPRKLGVIVAGSDIVAVDSVCCNLMGFDPQEIKHIANAALQGVGQINGFEVVGDPWKVYACQFERPLSIKATLKSFGAIKDIYIKK
jgi:uncharacterized protein (DUF362 family)